ncbi:MAG: host-nuclease inhibitor Gam family protein [Ekhidna sp.]|nr:host-nuclease inhibitor Gam family protein [Ekhidna sp.]
MSRTKKVLIKDVTKEEAGEAMHAFALANAREKQLHAKIEEQTIRIREKYKSDLDAAKEKKALNFDILHSYAESNDALFAQKKSLDMSHGVIGFRIGTPKLKARKGFTWAAVLELAKEKAAKFIRTKEEVAKDTLLACRNDAGMEEVMDAIKVEVVQDEAFFVEPKEEDAA